MPPFPFVLWQHFLDGDGTARFSLAAPEEVKESPVEIDAVPLESLRADVIVALFNHLTTASIEHPQLAPFLMDGLDSALETLSRCKRERELCLVQEWLCQEGGEMPDETEISWKNLGRIGQDVE